MRWPVLSKVFGVSLGVVGYGVHRNFPNISHSDWLVTACWIIALALIAREDWDVPFFGVFVAVTYPPRPAVSLVGMYLLVYSAIKAIKLLVA
jgi:hypothetical protein